MPRSVIIFLGTITLGLILFVASANVFGVVRKEPEKTILFFASLATMAILLTLLTRRMSPRSKPTENMTLEEMEQKGLLTHEKYEATRAFQVEEFEDEGCQYFIELKNGSVLFLAGQYLYDYEPMNSGRHKQSRKFPCTEFSVVREKRDNLIIDVVCGGTVIEPEGEAPHFTTEDFESERAPADGDIISNRSFDELKTMWMKKRQE